MSNLGSITYDNCVAVTPSDDTPDPCGPFSALLCTRAGTLQVILRDGTQLLLDSVNAGQTIPLVVKQVMASNTSANVLGLKGAPFTGIKS